MAKFKKGDIVRFIRHNSAGGDYYGKYREQAVVIEPHAAGPGLRQYYSLKREDNVPSVVNALEGDLALVKEEPIEGDDDPDCI